MCGPNGGPGPHEDLSLKLGTVAGHAPVCLLPGSLAFWLSRRFRELHQKPTPFPCMLCATMCTTAPQGPCGPSGGPHFGLEV